MPYYLERRGSRYKLRLRDDPQHEFSKKWLTKKEAIAQMQAIEIGKRSRRNATSIEGGNFLKNIFGKVKKGVSSVLDMFSAPAQTIVNTVDEKTQYIDSVKDILRNYGNFGIVSMTVERQPVESKIMFVANKITNGALRDLMIKHNIDAYYHLALRVDIVDADGRLIPFRIEKNENISITPYSRKEMEPGASSSVMTMAMLVSSCSASATYMIFFSRSLMKGLRMFQPLPTSSATTAMSTPLTKEKM